MIAVKTLCKTCNQEWDDSWGPIGGATLCRHDDHKDPQTSMSATTPYVAEHIEKLNRELRNPVKITSMGIELDEWKHKSCTARWGTGPDWATLYHIESKEEGKGHTTELLLMAKDYYKKQGKKVGGSVALNDRMRKLYQKVGIEEYL